MLERDLNTTIRNGFENILDKEYFSHKIADGMGGISIQNPFDGFAVIPEGHIYWEAKLLKPLKAFNFNVIEDHQYDKLNLIHDTRPDSSITIYPIGAFYPRKYYYLFIFDSELIRYIRSEGKKSVLKKEFTKLLEENLYLDIKRDKETKKYVIDFKDFEEKIITKDKWKNIIGDYDGKKK